MTDKEKIKILSDALSFYADPDTYFAVGFFPDSSCGNFMNDFGYYEESQEHVPGKHAREALKLVYLKDRDA